MSVALLDRYVVEPGGGLDADATQRALAQLAASMSVALPDPFIIRQDGGADAAGVQRNLEALAAAAGSSGAAASRFFDTYSSDSRSAYTYQSLSALGTTAAAADMSVSSDHLFPGASLKPVSLYPTARAATQDSMSRMSYFSSTSGSGYFGFVFRYIDPLNFLWCRIFSGGPNMQINKVDGGVNSSLIAPVSAGATANQIYALKLFVVGNKIRFEQQTNDWLGSSIPGVLAVTLGGADAAKFGSVVSPVYAYMNPGSSGNYIDELVMTAPTL